ncbi:AraC family transcriptional regulator [Ignavigranum ruoffiae]|uniref:AraC family transcriptional regulator n=1 Tax=Ignavigranum ruoffiae TaxID=89093 RepID=UPI002353BF4E|nr:AraC family transcriptional regulator [Ignavigranum ruoffiae]
MIAQSPQLFHRYQLSACHKTGKIYQHFPHLIYIEEGTGHISTVYDTNRLKHSMLAFVPANLEFMITSQSPKLTCILFSLSAPIKHQPFANQKSGLFLTECPNDFVSHCYLLLQQISKNNPHYPESFQAIQTLLINYLFNLTHNLTPVQNYTPAIQEALNYIHCHLTQPLKLTDLAQQVKLSSSRFSARFKAELDISPMAYIQHLRLNQIYYQLCNYPDSNLESLRQAYGFHNACHFTSIFRKKFGMTPLKVKKLAQSQAGHLMLPEEIDFFCNQYPQV